MDKVSTKQRILKLKDIFERETDSHKTLSLEEILKRLKTEYETKFGGKYEFERKAILDDIKELKESGFYVENIAGDHNVKLYYYEERLFDIYELRLLIDAVSSARFVTKEDTLELVKKIKNLTSEGMSKELQNQVYIDEMVKSKSEHLKYRLHEIHLAISQNKEMTFQYGNFNVDKEFVLHHNAEKYEVKPYGLVWNSDYYYLVCWDIKKNALINYRVDRMRNVSVSDKSFTKPNFNVAEHIKQSFNMYSGEGERLEIQFVNKLINVVIDRFGTDITIQKVDDQHFSINFKAAINEGLLRWILTWGADAKVIKPEELKDMLKNESEKMMELYK